jgi:uncharacterized protein
MVDSKPEIDMHFEWDRQKATSNLKKHGVNFDEASTVFDDPLAYIFDDKNHSQGENREIIIGHSLLNRLIVVSFAERLDAVRVISAREATKTERKDYEENANA